MERNIRELYRPKSTKTKNKTNKKLTNYRENSGSRFRGPYVLHNGDIGATSFVNKRRTVSCVFFDILQMNYLIN